MLYFPPSQVLDGNGNPVAGAKLNIYESGTSTPTTVYSDAGLTTALPNPIVADSGGYLPTFYSQVENLKLVLTNAQDVEIYTVDPAAGTRLAQVSPGIVDTASGPRMQVQDTLIRIDDPVLLGRLTETPQAYLHVVRGLGNPPGTTAPPANANALMIEGDQTTGMYFFAPDGDAARIAWGSPADAGYAEILAVTDASFGPLIDFVVEGNVVARINRFGRWASVASKTNTFEGSGLGTWEDVPGLEAKITPPTTNARMRLSASGTLSNTANNGSAFVRFTRDGIPIGVGDAALNRIQAAAGLNTNNQSTLDPTENFAINWVDVPGVTTEVSYKLQILATNFGTAVVGRSGLDPNSDTVGRMPTILIAELL